VHGGHFEWANQAEWKGEGFGRVGGGIRSLTVHHLVTSKVMVYGIDLSPTTLNSPLFLTHRHIYIYTHYTKLLDFN
jgi:hypothetical protein